MLLNTEAVFFCVVWAAHQDETGNPRREKSCGRTIISCYTISYLNRLCLHGITTVAVPIITVDICALYATSRITGPEHEMNGTYRENPRSNPSHSNLRIYAEQSNVSTNESMHSKQTEG